MATIGRLAVNIVADISGLRRGLKQAESEVDRSFARTRTAQMRGPGQGPGVQPRQSVGQALGGRPGMYSVRPERVGPSGLGRFATRALGLGALFMAFNNLRRITESLARHFSQMTRAGREQTRAWQSASNMITGTNARMAVQEERLRQINMDYGQLTQGLKEFRTEFEIRVKSALVGLAETLGMRFGRGRQMGYRRTMANLPAPLASIEGGGAFRLIFEAQMAAHRRAQRLARVQAAEDDPSLRNRALRDFALGLPVDPSVARRLILGEDLGGPENRMQELGEAIADGMIRKLLPALLGRFGQAINAFTNLVR